MATPIDFDGDLYGEPISDEITMEIPKPRSHKRWWKKHKKTAIKFTYIVEDGRSMTRTGHGHHIPGTTPTKGIPNPVTDCGGPGVCPRCTTDVEQYMGAVLGTAEDFQAKAKRLVARAVDDRLDKSRLPGDTLPAYELFVSSFTKVLKGWKATIGSTLDGGMYYEVTYDAEKRTTYVDEYMKLRNIHYPD